MAYCSLLDDVKCMRVRFPVFCLIEMAVAVSRVLRPAVIHATVGLYAATAYSQEAPARRNLADLLGPPAVTRDLGRDATESDTKAVSEGPRPLQGTVERPEKGVQHKDLDSAWNTYHAAIATATGAIKAAIAKQTDVATDKGDLDAVEKWERALATIENKGVLPSEKEVRTVVATASSEYKAAHEELCKAYERLVKALTIEKNLELAKAVREETSVLRGLSAPDRKSREQSKPQEERHTYLCDLQEGDVSVGFGGFGKNGALGYHGLRVSIAGVENQRSVSMHPPNNGAARVSYNIPKGATHFEAVAAINDTGANPAPLTFKVFENNRLLWASSPLRGAGASEICLIPVKAASTLTLSVECPGANFKAHAVWIEPRFHQRAK